MEAYLPHDMQICAHNVTVGMFDLTTVVYKLCSNAQPLTLLYFLLLQLASQCSQQQLLLLLEVLQCQPSDISQVQQSFRDSQVCYQTRSKAVALALDFDPGPDSWNGRSVFLSALYQRHAAGTHTHTYKHTHRLQGRSHSRA